MPSLETVKLKITNITFGDSRMHFLPITFLKIAVLSICQGEIKNYRKVYKVIDCYENFKLIPSNATRNLKQGKKKLQGAL